MIRTLIRYVRCERGFLSLSDAADIGGSLAGGLFGGGSNGDIPMPDGGTAAYNNNPLNYSDWKRAWARAPASVRDSAWRQALGLGYHRIMQHGAGASDTIRRDLLFHGANGGGNGDHSALESQLQTIARQVIASPAAPSSPAPSSPAPSGANGFAPNVGVPASSGSAGMGVDTNTLILAAVVLFIVVKG